MIDFPAPAHAVLSQNSLEHLPDLCVAYRASLNQADHHPHMLDHRLGPIGPVVPECRGHRPNRSGPICGPFGNSALVQVALLFLALWVAIVGDTPLRGLLLAMGLPAAKGTTQVVPAGIARMGEEENTAMPAPAQAGTQVRLGASNRSQEQIILRHQGGYRTPAIPTRPKLKMLSNPYCKKPKLSLKILTLNSMSSSYRIGTKVSMR